MLIIIKILFVQVFVKKEEACFNLSSGSINKLQETMILSILTNLQK